MRWGGVRRLGAVLARTTACTSVLPAAALAIASVGQVTAAPEVRAPTAVEAAQVDPMFFKIDGMLARKLPGLGLELRRRMANSLLRESRAAGFDPMLVFGLIEVESEFKADAISSADARGLMQIRPRTAEFLSETEGYKLTAEDIYRDPELQVVLGVRYLSRLEKRFGSLDKALMAYNAGPERLRSALDIGESTGRYFAYAKAVQRKQSKWRSHFEGRTELK